MESSQQSTTNTEEITLKELILKIKDWWQFLLGKWFLILIVGIMAAGIGLAVTFILPNKYEGEMTFVVEDNSSNPLSSYMGLASQFGIDLGVGGNTGLFQGDNILEFLKSRLMLERTLLSPAGDTSKQTLVDLYIDFNELHNKWKGKPGLEDIKFPLGQSRSTFSLKQDSILRILQDRILNKNLKIDKPDKKLDFISVKCVTKNERFSKVFVEHLVTQAVTFYVDTKVKRTKLNVDRLQSQADSLRIILDQKTYSAASIQDINANPARHVAGVSGEVANRDKIVLQTMYGEVIKNLELAKITMSQETPLIEIVDTPILPLENKKLKKLQGLLIGGVLGGILVVLWLIYRRTLSRIMNS